MLTIPRPCLAPINNLGWLASLLKFFMGLALVHFQKYCLLINYLGQFLELSKVRPLVTKHNNLFLSSITRKVQLNCNKFHLLITLYFNKHPLINFISIFRCLNAYYITISIIYISFKSWASKLIVGLPFINWRSFKDDSQRYEMHFF